MGSIPEKALCGNVHSCSYRAKYPAQSTLPPSQLSQAQPIKFPATACDNNIPVNVPKASWLCLLPLAPVRCLASDDVIGDQRVVNRLGPPGSCSRNFFGQGHCSCEFASVATLDPIPEELSTVLLESSNRLVQSVKPLVRASLIQLFQEYGG